MKLSKLAQQIALEQLMFITRKNLNNILIYIENKLIRIMAFLPLSAIVPRLSILGRDCILYVDFNHETLENGTIKPHLDN